MKRVVGSAVSVRALKALLYALLIVTGGLLADFAVNAVTGGTLPGPLDRYRYFAWPTIVVVFLASLAATFRERLPSRRGDQHPERGEQPTPAAGGPFNLPPRSAEFTGRRKQLGQLRALVPAGEPRRRSAPVVATIYGPTGAGKSTLAVRFAHDMRQHYPDAQLYVHLQSFGSEPLSTEPIDPIDALGSLLRALGVRGRDLPTDLEGLSSLYRAQLQGKRAIVVLDHAVDEAQVRPLLPGVATCLVLITSLQPLDELLGSEQLKLGPMEPDEAVTLLARIAGDHVRSQENLDATLRVAALCGHLPLALSIVGVLLRRQRRRSVTELELELTGKRNILTDLHVGHLDVRAGFDVSYDHLEPREKALFRRLRLLPEPAFGADMAAVLLDCPVEEAERLLDGLVDEQVLERVGDGQFVLQTLLGHYAEERLREEPSTNAGPRWSASCAATSPRRCATRCCSTRPSPTSPAGPRPEWRRRCRWTSSWARSTGSSASASICSRSCARRPRSRPTTSCGRWPPAWSGSSTSAATAPTGGRRRTRPSAR